MVGAWVPVLPLAEDKGILLPHSVATVRINLSLLSAHQGEARGAHDSLQGRLARASARLVLEESERKGGNPSYVRAQEEARRWFATREGEGDAKAVVPGAEPLLCAMAVVRPDDPKHLDDGERISALVEGNRLVDLHAVGCVCRVVKVEVDRSENIAVLVLEGVARARVSSASVINLQNRGGHRGGGGGSPATDRFVVMGHCSWPKSAAADGPGVQDIQNLAQALYEVQRNVFTDGPSGDLGRLTRSLWQAARSSRNLPLRETQRWATQVSDLLLASPLLDRLMSRHQRLGALLALETGKRVRVFTSILKAILSDQEALALIKATAMRGQTEAGSGAKPRSLVLSSKGSQRAPSTGPEDLDEWAELENKLLENLPEGTKVHREALREFKRIKAASKYRNMPPQPGDNMMRQWLECVASIPWKPRVPGHQAGEGEKGGTHQHVLLRAISTMDQRHFGLKPVKKRIVQYLAVQQLLREKIGAGVASQAQANSSGPVMGSPRRVKNPVILCLVGPPGVGKTSLAKTIAESLDRPFERISLGGVRDEAEIRGHRRTYIGAMAGRVVQALIRSQASDPVILLDEMDKAGTPDGGVSVRGDPLGALLEVLDPEQNSSFVDHYVGHALDLSQVFFIATANSLATMPPALRDRLEIVQLQAYTPTEKAAIGTRHLWPKVLANHGLPETHADPKGAGRARRSGGRGAAQGGHGAGHSVKIASLDPEVVEFVAENYTREAGVRQLERCLASICRHIATKVALDLEKRAKARALKIDPPATLSFRVDRKLVEEVLGAPKAKPSHKELCRRLETPGVTIGLAWTSAGVGTTQLVECCSITQMRPGLPGRAYVPGERDVSPPLGRLTLTGQLGEVLEESARIALTWVRAMCTTAQYQSTTTSSEAPRADPGAHLYDRAMFSDIHVHLPAGSIPKDGPSAGVTLVVALTSLLFGAKCRSDTAMTGEISLHGTVLPVGGVREKVRAAQKIGITRVVVPLMNQMDAINALKREGPSSAEESATGAGAGAGSSSSETKMEIIACRSVEEALEAAIVGGNPWNAFASPISQLVAKL